MQFIPRNAILFIFPSRQRCEQVRERERERGFFFIPLLLLLFAAGRESNTGARKEVTSGRG